VTTNISSKKKTTNRSCSDAIGLFPFELLPIKLIRKRKHTISLKE